MMRKNQSLLSPKKRYLQIALNSTLSDARAIISALPRNERIILEAGTPLIKRYGEAGIASIVEWYRRHLSGQPLVDNEPQSLDVNFGNFSELFSALARNRVNIDKPPMRSLSKSSAPLMPYVVADLKMMDRGGAEVEIAARAGARAAVALGMAPIESLDAFIEECQEKAIDAMIDMMNVPFPLSVLRQLKKQPTVVVLHRGVDETERNKEKMLPLHEIRRVKGNYNLLVSVAGGDSIKEVQSAIFNDADIVVVWKSFFRASGNIGELATQFLEKTK